MTVEPTRTTESTRRFTVDEYHRMVDTGILSEDDRVELIDGEVIEMVPIGSGHAGHLKRINRLFSDAVGDEAILGVQDPIQLGEHSEPQPDLAVLKSREDFYTESHPTADDVLLIVEVADTSLSYDRMTKVPLYARHGVPAVWILNLQDREVIVCEDPDPDGYQSIKMLRGDHTVEHSSLELQFDIDELFV